MANYGSDGYWDKEIRKAENRGAKDIDGIKRRYEEKPLGKKAYKEALSNSVKLENRNKDSKFVYELAQTEMKLANQDKNDRGWTCADS